jgi:hypothetical protein
VWGDLQRADEVVVLELVEVFPVGVVHEEAELLRLLEVVLHLHLLLKLGVEVVLDHLRSRCARRRCARRQSVRGAGQMQLNNVVHSVGARCRGVTELLPAATASFLFDHNEGVALCRAHSLRTLPAFSAAAVLGAPSAEH